MGRLPTWRAAPAVVGRHFPMLFDPDDQVVGDHCIVQWSHPSVSTVACLGCVDLATAICHDDQAVCNADDGGTATEVALPLLLTGGGIQDSYPGLADRSGHARAHVEAAD